MSTEPAAEPLDVVAAWAAYRRAAAALAWLEADHVGAAGDLGGLVASVMAAEGIPGIVTSAEVVRGVALAAFAAVVAAEAAALAHALAEDAAGILSREIATDEALAAGGSDSLIVSDDETDEDRAEARAYATSGTVHLAAWHVATDAAADVASAARQSAAALLDVAGYEGEHDGADGAALPALLAAALLPSAVGAAIGQPFEHDRALYALRRRLWGAANVLTNAAKDDPTDGAP